MIEDILRFSNKKIFIEVRKIRHEAGRMKNDFKPSLIKHRDTSTDFYNELLPTGYRDLTQVLSRNFERVKDSIRVIEEVLRIHNEVAAFKASKMRFRIYNLEKKILMDLYEKG